MHKIDYEFIKIKDLVEFAVSANNNKKRYPFLPVTEIRARSQAKNPVANEDDVGLIVIYYNNICAGYLGLLPCLMKKNHEVNKVFAFSTFYVAPEYRDFKIAYKIMELAFSLNYDYFYSGYTDAFYKFSLKNPQWFKRIHDTEYLQINMDLLFPVLVELEKRRREFNSIFSKKPLLWIVRVCLYGARKLSHQKNIARFIKNKKVINYSAKNNISIKPVKNVNVIEGYVSELPGNNYHFYRNEEIINWMIHNPWISENPDIKRNYYFSLWRSQFKYLVFEYHCKIRKTYLGFTVFNISARGGITTLKILDNEVTNEQYLILIIEQAIKLAVDNGADKIIAPDYLFDTIQLDNKLKGLTVKRSKGNFLGPAKESVFPSDHQKIRLQYCEGDIPFS